MHYFIHSGLTSLQKCQFKALIAKTVRLNRVRKAVFRYRAARSAYIQIIIYVLIASGYYRKRKSLISFSSRLAVRYVRILLPIQRRFQGKKRSFLQTTNSIHQLKH